MARERQKFASVRPSQAEEGGGKFTIPSGSECKVTEATWTEWREAGEGALKGGRAPEDPALKVTCEVKGMEEPMTEFLGAGKASRLVPSRDGEHLEPADGSNADRITKDCNADVFLASICDKRHKGMAFDEALLDDGISSLVGLEFISGRKLVERNIEDNGGDGKKGKGPRPTLIATEIVKLPKGGGGSRKSSRDEDDEKPAKGRGKDADEGGDAEVEEAAEKALMEVLEMPKYAKGIHRDKAFAAVYNVVKGEKNGKTIAAQVEDKDWIEGKRRPWVIDDEGTITSA